MTLPKVTINYQSGALGRVLPSADGVTGLIATAAAVSSTFALGTVYEVRSMDGVAELGITEANNPGLYKVLSEFFGAAGGSAELWLMGVADTVTLTQMADPDQTHGKLLLNTANGRIRTLMIHRTPGVEYSPEVTNGIDADCESAIAKAQLLGDWATNTLKTPILTIVPALYFSGTASDLSAMNERTDDRVAMMLGDTAEGNGCAIGLLGGRIARSPVQRNVGRVRDGAIVSDQAYIGAAKVENAAVATIHNKGFITLRTHAGRAGYYFTDDPLCNISTDDYNGIAVRRVIDKAYRVAYQAISDELLNEITVNDQGQVSVSYAKSIENKMENAIINSMTINGELGNDPADQNDTAVECVVDPTINVVATGKLLVELRVKPHGYAKFIEVNLGFKILTP